MIYQRLCVLRNFGIKIFPMLTTTTSAASISFAAFKKMLSHQIGYPMPEQTKTTEFSGESHSLISRLNRAGGKRMNCDYSGALYHEAADRIKALQNKIVELEGSNVRRI